MPIEVTDDGKVETKLQSPLFLILMLVYTALVAFNLYSIILFYDLSFGVFGIATVIFYMAVNASFQVIPVLSYMAKKIGIIAVDLKYQVWKKFYIC